MVLRGCAIMFLWVGTAFGALAQGVVDSVATEHLQEIVVTNQSARARLSNRYIGRETLELKRLALTPRMFGEVDIIKSITLLPGVRAQAEGVGGFEVRGGNAYQNLVTLDGMTLYNPAHLMGIFSTFNDDIVGRAILHKGPIPAGFGEAASSVLELYTLSGDMERYHGSASVGLLNAKLAVNGPLVKDKLSFALAARRSYVDVLLGVMPKYESTVMNFYDVNAKLRYKIHEGSLLDLSFFASRDNLAISKLMNMSWGNVSGSINWSHRRGDKWRFVTTGTGTNYTTDMGANILEANQSLAEYIRTFAFNEKAIYSISDDHSLEFGLRSELFRVKSGDMMLRQLRMLEVRSGWQNALWASYEGNWSPRLSVVLGLRTSAFSALSAPRFHSFSSLNEESPDFSSKTYIHLEPRGSIKYTIDSHHNLKLGASLTTQSLHGIRSTTTTFPFDRYALVSANVLPQLTAQYSGGYAGMRPDGAWDWSVEGYYKSMDNVYDYREGVTMFSRIGLESLILRGQGRSYGLELMLRKNTGRLSGWISYTLSKTETKIPGVNEDRWYDASNDRRHDLAIVGLYDLSRRWKLSASWTYLSGRPMTAPEGKYEVDGLPRYYYTKRNAYKMPPSHRLDLSATYTKVGKRTISTWTMGVYNAYCYYSPFVIYFEDDPAKPSGTRAVRLSLFGIVPSVSYNIKF